MRIVFMGTPEFAVPCLERLVFDGYDVVGVFTQPDKPKGRGHKMQFPPVKEKAAEFNIPVFQPTKMKDGTAYGILKELDPELIIVVAYGYSRFTEIRLCQYPRFASSEIQRSGTDSMVRSQR